MASSLHLSKSQTFCESCEVVCGKRKQFAHLISPPHLIKSQGRFVKWGRKEKERSVLVSSNFPLMDFKSGGETAGKSCKRKLEQEKSSGVVELFGEIISQGLDISDFVFWEEDPLVAVIQLGTKKMASKAVSRFGGNCSNNESARIKLKGAGGVISLKKMTTFTTLELRDTLPERAGILRSGEPPQMAEELQFEVVDLDLKGERSVQLLEGHEDNHQVSTQAHHPVAAGASHQGRARIRKNEGFRDHSISRLRRLAREREWEAPKMRFSSHSTCNGIRYRARYIVNGIEYAPDAAEGEALTVHDTEMKAAAYALRNISLQSTSTSQKGIKFSGHLRKFKAPLGMKLNATPTDILRMDYESAWGNVRIPSQRVTVAHEMLNHLRKVLQAVNPSIQAVFFRTFFQKLKSGVGGDEVLVQVFTKGPFDENKLRERILETLRSSKRYKLDKDLRGEITFLPEGPKFKVVTDKGFSVESRLNRLVAYMRQFDPRLSRLLMLMRYWAQLNHQRFEKRQLGIEKLSQKMCLPFPNCLDWLVILYVCRKKIIPTVREIQERPHHPFVERETGVDIGFESDLDFVAEWNVKNKNRQLSPEQVDLAALELFCEVLVFYGLNAGTPCVLNTRDAEVIPRDEAMKGKDLSKLSKLTKDEITLMRSVHQGSSDYVPPANRKSRKVPEKGGLDLKPKNVCMIHPFMLHWIVWLPEDIEITFKIMGDTAKSLDQYIQAIASDRKPEHSLVSVLKLSEPPSSASPLPSASTASMAPSKKNARKNKSKDTIGKKRKPEAAFNFNLNWI